MPKDILDSQRGILGVLEATSGTYVAPTAAAFLQTVGLKAATNESDKKSLTLDSFGRPQKKNFSSKKHRKIPAFGVPISWPAAAPTATTNLLACSPFMEACGASAPVLVAATTAPIVPAHVKYTELDNANAVKSMSLSERIKAETMHYERRMANSRGIQKFKWKSSEVPQFEFEFWGNWLAQTQVAAINPTVGTQLANIAQPSNNTNTVNALLNTTKALCLSEINDDNLWRMKVAVIESLCGAGPKHQIADDSALDVTFKMPDIAAAAEFNPDLYWGGDYPFEFTIKGDGALNVRSLRFSWALVNVEQVDEVAIDGYVYKKAKLTKLSPLILQHF